MDGRFDWVCGKTDSIAPGKPCSPPMSVIRISFSPLLRVIEDFQPEFGPCCLLSPKPQHFPASIGSNPQRKNTRPCFSRALHPESEAAAHRNPQWDTCDPAGASAIVPLQPALHRRSSKSDRASLPIHTVSIHACESRAHSSRERTDGSHAHQHQASAADISQYAQDQKSKARRVESPGAHHPQAGSPFRRYCRCGDCRFSLGALLLYMMAQFSLQHPLSQPFLELTCKPRFA